MANQPDLNPSEHLQQTLLQIHNAKVRRHFRDTPGEGDRLSVNVPRQSLKRACLMQDTDNLLMSLCRFVCFEYYVNQGKSFIPPLYGVPRQEWIETVVHRPQITLHFLQNASEAEAGKVPVAGQISFRLMNETSTTITEIELKKIALKIRNIFLKPRRKWIKGKKCYSYYDKANGYQCKLFGSTDAHIRDLIKDVLSIQNHTFKEELFREHGAVNPAKAFPDKPKNIRVLGKPVTEPHRRPRATVWFTSALCDLDALVKPIPLVDITGYYPDAFYVDIPK